MESVERSRQSFPSTDRQEDEQDLLRSGPPPEQVPRNVKERFGGGIRWLLQDNGGKNWEFQVS